MWLPLHVRLAAQVDDVRDFQVLVAKQVEHEFIHVFLGGSRGISEFHSFQMPVLGGLDSGDDRVVPIPLLSG